MAREERFLTACASCRRIKVDERWVKAEVAIRRLRTYDWPEPPLFTQGLCDHCLGVVTASPPAADDDVLPSRAA
jgi:hypothetical protein